MKYKSEIKFHDFGIRMLRCCYLQEYLLRGSQKAWACKYDNNTKDIFAYYSGVGE